MSRTTKEIMEGMNVFYTDTRIYLVQDNYAKNLSLIKATLEYAASELGVVLPGEDKIDIITLSGPRFKRCMSIEFPITNKPTKGTFLTPDSGLWQWLVY